MRKSLALLSSLAIGAVALTAAPTSSEAHWWWYGGGSGSGSGSGSGGSTNTSSTAPGFSRTYVSPGGDDANGCSVNDPCRTFQRAHNRTFINGEINCSEAGGYGPVAITKSITIDCKEVPASINAGTSSTSIGVSINIPASTNDPLPVVRLRGFTISGSGGQTATSATAVTGIGTKVGLRGISITNASVVYIEHLVISDFTGQAIQDTRTTGGQLFILDTVVRNNGGSAINTPPGGNAVTNLDNVRSEGNNYGLAIGNTSRTMVNRSVFSGNTAAGIEVDAGGSVIVSNSVMSFNGSGLLVFGTARSSNSEITFNTTGVTGPWTSFGNNRVVGNTAAGSAPTVAAQQ